MNNLEQVAQVYPEDKFLGVELLMQSIISVYNFDRYFQIALHKGDTN